MDADFDSIVIGAGVIGLAVARELALKDHSVLVLEKAAHIGTETSARNSEVIHAGIYYPSGTLKTRFCVEGRGLLYEYCATHGVEAKRLGKIIAAATAAEEIKLRWIKDLADVNGVRDLTWLTPDDVARLEPEISCTSALLSPSTGIVDASGFMLSLQGEIESHGGNLALDAKFLRAKWDDGNFVVSTNSQGETIEVTCHSIFNCAGHGAHDAARAIAGYETRHLPPQFFAQGNYCSLSGASPFKHLIYPVPVSGALGIHATLDMGGAVRFGPNIRWVDGVDYTLPPGLPEIFSEPIASYWPGVRDRTLSPSYCGIRPKVHGPDQNFADFIIQGPLDHGVRGLINLFGIESPGLTSSLAIAKYVCRDQWRSLA